MLDLDPAKCQKWKHLFWCFIIRRKPLNLQLVPFLDLTNDEDIVHHQIFFDIARCKLAVLPLACPSWLGWKQSWDKNLISVSIPLSVLTVGNSVSTKNGWTTAAKSFWFWNSGLLTWKRLQLKYFPPFPHFFPLYRDYITIQSYHFRFDFLPFRHDGPEIRR